jgi:hypothetical protein
MTKGVMETLVAAAGSLAYAADALEAPAGSHMREVMHDLRRAANTTLRILATLEHLVERHGALRDSPSWDGRDEILQDDARWQIANAKGEVK